MIIKNGEILAIDHIAHDNTLSGNGTSAKPVGLSQSTKDLIDSKVKKTDFETYKSSAANQISNINTKITTDESNFESYKSSAANQINTINNKIAADEADFNSYKSSAHNEIANQVSTLNGKITDVANAKQDKGNYVSASDFNTFKSSAHNEIARVDEKIDTTSDNLRDNYYKTSETYNRTEVDEKFANFGGFKFRDPDPTKDNEPKLAPGEVIDPKAIYLTQPAGASQYLQWIWNTEVTPNVWKCIGDTTMDLSDYAKTVDVVASANANKTEVKNWADAKFETKQDFESVIAGYYTKDEADDLLNTKVDKTTFEVYQQTVSDAFDSVNRDFENTSAWANNTFATKTDLNDVQTDLEREISNLSTDIESDLADVSGKIINELNDVESTLGNEINNVDTKLDTVSGELVGKIKTVEEILSGNINAVDKKVDDLKTELETEYYDADTIEDILAASGDYYDKGEIDSLLDNYVKTEELEPINEKIDSVSAEFNKYYTKTDVDDKFTTKDTFDTTITEINDDLDDIVETVSAIDQDVASLSAEIDKKFNTVIESSDSVIATPTTKPDGTISYSLSAIGGGGSQSNYLWKPTVDEAGEIEWSISVTTDTPEPANIKGPKGDKGDKGDPGDTGPQGPQGEAGAKGDKGDKGETGEQGPQGEAGAKGDKGDKGDTGPQGLSGDPGEDGITPHIGENNHWFIGDEDTNIPATGPQGPAGTNGTNGEDGVSPTVTVTNIPADPLDPIHQKGGTEITITDATSTNKFSAWNGNDGTMAGAPGIEGKNGISAVLDGSTYEVGLSGEFYTAVTSVSSKLDASVAASTYATKDALDDYLTKNDAAESYQSKGNYLSANALNGYATEQYVQGASAEVTAWVNGQGYLKSVPAGYATETWVNDQGFLKSVPDTYALKSDIPTTVAQLTDSANYYTINQTSAASELTTEFAKYALKANIPTKVTDLTDSANYYTINQTSAASELTTEFAKYTKTEDLNIPSKVTDLSDSANYVATADLLTAASNKLTGIKVGNTNYEIPLFNGVTADNSTITGDGNTNPLGVAWSALSGYTITSALSAGSATVAANLGTSSFADITGAINAKTDKPADMTSNTPYCFSAGQWADMTQTYYSKTEATGTFLQKNLTNTLSGDGTSSNKLGVNWSNLSGNTITSALSAGSASYAVALGTTASYSALSDITGAINDAKFTGVNIADGSSITGNGLSTNKLGLVTSAENALTAVDNKLDKTAIVTATIDNTNYVTAVNINSTNIPIKGTSFWEVTAATGTTASNDTWQHYISTTNTFNYYKMVIHPNGTSSAQEWANDGIIHIILEA